MAIGPLDGIKIMDFTWLGAGPICTKQLADMGATVVKVESSKHLDSMRTGEPFKDNIPGVDRTAMFLLFNTGKMSMVLNMGHPKGLEVAKRLVKWADVMMENFSPGTIVRMGLGYDVVKEINPTIIMVSSSILGTKGSDNPIYQGYRGYNNTGIAVSGHTFLTGWPDLEPASSITSYADAIQPLFSAMAILSALDYRRRTGKGQFLDTTQIEPLAQNMGPAILDYQANERAPVRMGNRHPSAAPHSAFRCRDGEYCVIAVFTQEQWQALCRTIGQPTLTEDARFATAPARKAHEDELEKIVEAWTQNYTPKEVMEKLKGVRVPAGVVQTTQDLMDKDPQLKALGSFVKLEHPVMGLSTHWAPPFKLSLTPGEVRTAPLLGEHTEHVCTDILQMSKEEFEALKGEGVFE